MSVTSISFSKKKTKLIFKSENFNIIRLISVFILEKYPLAIKPHYPL